MTIKLEELFDIDGMLVVATDIEDAIRIYKSYNHWGYSKSIHKIERIESDSSYVLVEREK